MEKYTKKATARVLKEVLKYNPKASGFTTLDQAYVILMNAWDMEIDVVNDKNNTTSTLYRDGDKVHTWEFGDCWSPQEGDFDWNTIYRKVLEDIIRLKLYKRPKLGKRAMKKLEEERALRKPEVDDEGVTKALKTVTEVKPTLQDLRKKRDNLSVKLHDWKKKGKDITELQKELNRIKEQIKNFK